MKLLRNTWVLWVPRQRPVMILEDFEPSKVMAWCRWSEDGMLVTRTIPPSELAPYEGDIPSEKWDGKERRNKVRQTTPTSV